MGALILQLGQRGQHYSKTEIIVSLARTFWITTGIFT